MSQTSQDGKEVWTFVPERSRVPPNRRATKRQTTVRAFTFVRDWDPRVSPLPILHNASQKESLSQSTASHSSQESIRESPIAQLVRSSPGPIIIAKRSHGNKSFRSPLPRSPSSSQSSVRSGQSPGRRSPRKQAHSPPTNKPLESSTPSQEETGVDPSFPLTQSRERHSSGSTTRSPVTERSHTDSVQSVDRLEEAVQANAEQQDVGSPARGQRSTTKGQTPVNQTSASKNVQSALSKRTRDKSGSSERTKTRPKSASRVQSRSSDSSSQATSLPSTRRRRGGSSQPRRKRTLGGSIRKSASKSKTALPHSPEVLSSSDSQARGVVLSKHNVSNLSGPRAPPSSSSDASLEDIAVHDGKSRRRGAPGRGNRSRVVNNRTPAKTRTSKSTARTPADKSMSLLAVTPRSGPVQRPRARIAATAGPEGDRRGPRKGKSGAGAKKRGVVSSRSESSEDHEEEEPSQKRAKVRLWTTGARPRLVTDTTDLDIILNNVEDTAADFKEALEVPGHKRAVTKFFLQARKELVDMIGLQQDFKMQNSVVSRTKASIRRYRRELLTLQQENARLDSKIAELKKSKWPDASQSEDMKGIISFLEDLQAVHENYAKKFPDDLKTLDFGSPSNVPAAICNLKSSCQAATTLRSLNDKMQDWIDNH